MLAYLGLVVAAGASIATSPCGTEIVSILDHELVLDASGASQTVTFEHTGTVALTIDTPVRVVVETGELLPDELPEPNGAGGAGSPTSTPSPSRGVLIEPGTETVEVLCGDCPTLSVRVTPWESLSEDTPVTLHIRLSTYAGSDCSNEEYDLWIREKE